MVSIHTYYSNGSLTPNESGGKSEKDQRKNFKHQSKFSIRFRFCSVRMNHNVLEPFSRNEHQWNTLLRVTSPVKLLTEPSLKFILFNEIKEKYFKESLTFFICNDHH